MARDMLASTKMSPEYCKKISDAKLGHSSWSKGLNKHTDERVAKFSHECSESTKAKISAALKGKPSKLRGRTLPDEVIAKMSASQMGRIYSEDSRRKMSLAKGLRVMYIETGVIYNSMIDAGKFIGFKSNNPIARCVKNPDETAKGLHWKVIE